MVHLKSAMISFSLLEKTMQWIRWLKLGPRLLYRAAKFTKNKNDQWNLQAPLWRCNLLTDLRRPVHEFRTPQMPTAARRVLAHHFCHSFSTSSWSTLNWFRSKSKEKLRTFQALWRVLLAASLAWILFDSCCALVLSLAELVQSKPPATSALLPAFKFSFETQIHSPFRSLSNPYYRTSPLRRAPHGCTSYRVSLVFERKAIRPLDENMMTDAPWSLGILWHFPMTRRKKNKSYELSHSSFQETKLPYPKQNGCLPNLSYTPQIWSNVT